MAGGGGEGRDAARTVTGAEPLELAGVCEEVEGGPGVRPDVGHPGGAPGAVGLLQGVEGGAGEGAEEGEVILLDHG